MSFTARYHGRCGSCEEQITPGQEVAYDADGDVVHESCEFARPSTPWPKSEDAELDLTPGESCDECFTIKAVNGACACVS